MRLPEPPPFDVALCFTAERGWYIDVDPQLESWVLMQGGFGRKPRFRYNADRTYLQALEDGYTEEHAKTIAYERIKDERRDR